jgi:hypothetical protein
MRKKQNSGGGKNDKEIYYVSTGDILNFKVELNKLESDLNLNKKYLFVEAATKCLEHYFIYSESELLIEMYITVKRSSDNKEYQIKTEEAAANGGLYELSTIFKHISS